MSKQIEALKLVRDRLASMNHEDSIFAGEFDEEIKLLDEAIEQPAPAQEPVAWGNFKEDGTLVGLSQHPEDQANWTGRRPLYTTPPAPAPAQEPDPDELTIAYMSGLYEGKKRKPWVNLTVDELIDLEHKHRKHEDLVRAIEAKLKEKNGTTPPAPYDQTELELCDECGWKTLIPESGCLNCERSKTKKPLTDEQIMEMYNEPRSDAEMIAFARAIEAAHGITKGGAA
jgi:hypothetical protein